MMSSGLVRPLCIAIALVALAPHGLTQVSTSQTAEKAAAPQPVGQPLRIVILEGNNSINSIPLMRSVPPVIEVHDSNEFPIEGANVVFTLPDIGPGGSFPGGATKYSTRTDSHGQAGTPLFLPRTAGKFQIKVAVTYGVLKGEDAINQTNSPLTSFGKAPPPTHWYMKKKNLIILGSVVVAGVIILVVTTGGSSSSSNIVITPGTPVFH